MQLAPTFSDARIWNCHQLSLPPPPLPSLLYSISQEKVIGGNLIYDEHFAYSP